MSKYKYVTVDNEAILGSKFTKHRDVIDEHVEKGFRLIGIIPIKSDAHGKIQKIDLIFEKQE